MPKHTSSSLQSLGAACISRIVEMAWEDRTVFEAIQSQFGLNESAVIALMRRQMKPSSFRMWRKRMAGRRTKHAALYGAIQRNEVNGSRMALELAERASSRATSR